MNVIAMKAQLIAAEKIEFDAFRNQHSLANVLNSMTVPLFPAAVITDVLVKINFESRDYTTEAEFTVVSPEGKIVCSKSSLPIKNLRTEKEVPGIDLAFNARFPVVEKGNYYYKLVVNNQLLCEYPVYIYSKG